MVYTYKACWANECLHKFSLYMKPLISGYQMNQTVLSEKIPQLNTISPLEYNTLYVTVRCTSQQFILI